MKHQDVVEMAGAIDELRENLNAAVAGLIADGFTDREARSIIAGVFAPRDKKKD